jgi:hypothetical protein
LSAIGAPDKGQVEVKADVAVTREESPIEAARRVAFALALAQHGEAPAIVEGRAEFVNEKG